MPPEREFPKNKKAHHFPLLFFIAGVLLLDCLYFWLHLVGPFDSSRLEPVEPTWQAGGVVVIPLEEKPGPLRQGDLVVAVEGKSLEEWANALFEPGKSRPHWQVGQTITYTLIREGQRLEVPVLLGNYPLWAALAKGWGVFLCIIFGQIIVTWVFLLRPHDQAARVIFLAVTVWLGSLLGWVLGLQISDLVDGWGFWFYRLPIRGTYLLGYIGFLHFALIFPKPHPLVARYPSRLWLLYLLPYLFYAGYLLVTRLTTASTLHWLGSWHTGERLVDLTLLALVVLVGLQSYFRDRNDLITRQQIRLLAFAIAFSAGLSIILGFIPEIILGRGLVDWNSLMLLALPVPLALAASILRYHLFDIELIINRALVYGVLTLLVVGIYVVVVGLLGVFFQSNGNLITALLATAVVAVVFQPLRERVQRTINRFIYGERDDPYAVISRLGERLEAAFAPEATLEAIVETVAQALKLPYVEISLKQADEFKVASCYGHSREIAVCLPLVYQNEIIGQLKLAARAPGEAFSSSDRRLFSDLARQVGVAAHAVRLTADLQRSRERLVTTREEERRRLRRDLHDGHGPLLAALTLKVGSARYLFEQNPVQAKALLVELESDLKSALSDIRRLVYNLRPPALDELGLVAALREITTQYGIPTGAGVGTNNNLHITVEAPPVLPQLPAAVEVAVYRIVQEALTNVVRHAQARTCKINLRLSDRLEVEIWDDGLGLPPQRHVGVGLTSMRERAQELGGSCLVQANPAGGTCVVARLPLPANPE